MVVGARPVCIYFYRCLDARAFRWVQLAFERAYTQQRAESRRTDSMHAVCWTIVQHVRVCTHQPPLPLLLHGGAHSTRCRALSSAPQQWQGAEPKGAVVELGKERHVGEGLCRRVR